MNKFSYVFLAGLLCSGMTYAVVQYSKNPDGTILKSEVLSSVQAGDTADQILAKINQVNDLIAMHQNAITDLTKQRSDLQAEMDSLTSANK